MKSKPRIRVLFVCKKGVEYGTDPYHAHRRFSGLFNSTKFVSDVLAADDRIISKVVVVTDNNDIDREMHDFKPDICVIEALWVVPDKFPILHKLHPKTKFYVHLHSDIPFLSHEGNAIGWIKDYLAEDVGIISNSKETVKAIGYAVSQSKDVTFLPNCYPSFPLSSSINTDPILDVGCFGAIRPLKNQLIQAVAAIKYAKDTKKKLRFHVNATRVEGGGDGILKNLRSLFAGQEHARLVEHSWHTHSDFLAIIKRMNLVMQVSYSETFCVVAADAISSGIPVVASPEVDWLSHSSMADPNKVDDIIAKMTVALRSKLLLKENQVLLRYRSYKAKKLWLGFIIEKSTAPRGQRQ